MGLNTVLLINNDYLHEIDQDVERWWKEVYIAIQGMRRGQLSSGTRVVALGHSSETMVVAVGGGASDLLGASAGGQHSFTKEKRVDRIVRNLAYQHGYYLRRIPHAKARRTRQAPEPD